MKKYDKSVEAIIKDAETDGVRQLICVGTDARSSVEAVEFIELHENCFAAVGIHPHEAANLSQAELQKQLDKISRLLESSHPQIVAIGECGLDYFYHESVDIRNRQKELFRHHLELAVKYQLPMIFHVREAFDDFFSVVGDYENIRGVVHSFSANSDELKRILDHGFYIGLNGIMTFTKQPEQLKAAKAVPLEKMVLETDAPFLTPEPFRGKMCEPKHVRVTAEFLSGLRGENLEHLAERTTQNARQLFGLEGE